MWTDTLQTTFMLLAVVLSVVLYQQGAGCLISILVWLTCLTVTCHVCVITDWDHPRHFVKQFFSGMFITITMTGLDQEMMQKNLSMQQS
ncbi:MAG: hypothetical protein MZV63_35285 [Marinilabiliales bacterium]|nr:hypothetical protein [Marinilabiliales bacterium]